MRVYLCIEHMILYSCVDLLLSLTELHLVYNTKYGYVNEIHDMTIYSCVEHKILLLKYLHLMYNEDVCVRA